MSDFNLARLQSSLEIAELDYHAEIGSTSDRAIELLKRRSHTRLPALPLLILADRQTAGRGQHDRNWISTDGSLTLTLCVWSHSGGTDSLFPLVVGLAACLGIERAVSGVSLELKWPNDVLLNNRKLGGILVEQITVSLPAKTAETDPPDAPLVQQTALVIGIGINANNPISVASLQSQIEPQNRFAEPTSLAQELGQRVDRQQLVIEIVKSVLQSAERLDNERERMVLECAQRMPFGDREIEVALPGGESIVGRFAGIGSKGELMVRRGGNTEQIVSGSVIRW